jgi:hypothetical protein
MTSNACLANMSWTESFSLSTSFFVYRRTATVTYSRTNFSIISVDDLTRPKPFYVSVSDMVTVLEAVVNSFHSNSSSSSAQDLGSFSSVVLPIGDSEVARIIALKNARKVFAVALHYFHANCVGGDAVWTLKEPRPGLPPDMYTTVSIAVPSYHVVAGRKSLWIFVALESALLLLCLTTMLLSCRTVVRWPRRTGYPALDFAIYCLSSNQQSLKAALASLKGGSAKAVEHKLDGRRVIAR